MQVNFVAVAVTALVATAAAATNSTNGTVNGTIPAPPGGNENVAFNNAVSGGLLGAVVAAGLVLVL